MNVSKDLDTLSQCQSNDREEQDWRLVAELDLGDARGALRNLVERLRGPNTVKEIEAKVKDDVVITHDGKLLFAYSSSETGLAAARIAIEEVLRKDGITASLRVSHWDDEFDNWRQTEPPVSGQEKLAQQAADRQADAIDTRTFVATSGNLVRVEFEQSMRDWADKLGLKCEIIEHPHLLSTQVAFTVTGPRRKIEEFSQGLIAEGRAYIRTEGAVMLSPL
jgi:hypothetical protein